MNTNKKLNLLFITHYSEMYGANKSMLRILLELKNEYSIYRPIVLLPNEGSICELLRKNNITYIVSHFYWWVYEEDSIKARLHNIAKQLRNFARIFKIIKMIGNNRIDVVYTNSITINIGTFIAFKYKCPHIWHIRESLKQFRFKLGMGKLLARRFLALAADCYILISDFLVQEYKYLLPSNKMVRIYNGVRPSATKRQKKEISGVIHLCILGVICEQKNQMDAVRALDILVNERLVSHIHLHLAGSAKAEYTNELKNYIKTRSLEKHITYYGHIYEIGCFLNGMDVGLVCARDEAFGRVTIEFMMNTMPVIVSRSGANEELIQDGINAFSYELYNSQDLADKIECFANHTESIEKMGGAAYDHAIKNFPSEKNVQAIDKLIASIAKKYHFSE